MNTICLLTRHPGLSVGVHEEFLFSLKIIHIFSPEDAAMAVKYSTISLVLYLYLILMISVDMFQVHCSRFHPELYFIQLYIQILLPPIQCPGSYTLHIYDMCTTIDKREDPATVKLLYEL